MKGVAYFGEDFFTIKEDNDLIRESISRILLTVPQERVMSSFGCRLKEYIFDPSSVLQEEVISEIRRSIVRWEPGVEIQEITADMTSDNTVNIEVSLINKESLEPFTYEAIIRL